ncbi:hypothetical protein [Parvibaculum sp.]|jgi:ApbE superfamily uncharacterized protein (UPF0280 family)|uniref:hypothetical protein n=1 Tax=Parvibaculum sp. TaxID=2024848 RepID=UPI003C74B826
MFALSAPIEKSFEMWPGKITFAAEGAGAPEALDAATDMARALCRAVIEDAELLASGGSVLPRGRAGRHAAEVAMLFREVQGVELPPVVAALPGAVCDVVLEVMREAAARAGGADFIAVSLGDAVAIHRDGRSVLPVNSGLPPMPGEFLRALGGGVQGGAALGGVHSAVPTRGAIDLVATFSRNAAMAGFAAAMIADASADGCTPPAGALPRDRLYAAAWGGRRVAAACGVVEPEIVWDALSASVRQAAALRDRRLLSAAALGFKGRGRLLGAIDGDRLLRFGVSEWR